MKSISVHLVVRTVVAVHAFVAWVNHSVLTSVRNTISRRGLVQISLFIVFSLVVLSVKKRENSEEEVKS